MVYRIEMGNTPDKMERLYLEERGCPYGQVYYGEKGQNEASLV
jgi:hypothetical protein